MQIEAIGVPTTGRYTYVATGKTDVSDAPISGPKESAYAWLANTMQETFGNNPVSALEVYDEILRGMKLSFAQTEVLLTNATKQGYLRRGLVGR